MILLPLLLLSGCLLRPIEATLDSEAPTRSVSLPAAPDFRLPTLGGSELTLAELRGQWILINFWATWCAPCREEMPYLQALTQRDDLPLIVVGVNMRESAADVTDFVEEVGVTFSIVLQPDDATLLAYDVMGLPVSAVIAPDGSLVRRIVGPITPEAFDRWLLDAIADYETASVQLP